MRSESQLVTSLGSAALSTYWEQLHSSFQEAARQEKINTLICDV